MNEADIFTFLVNNLRLESSTESEYTGGIDGEPLYSRITTVRLMLGDRCLGEIGGLSA